MKPQAAAILAGLIALVGSGGPGAGGRAARPQAHLLDSDALTTASRQQVIGLLRPCLRSLTRAGLAPEG